MGVIKFNKIVKATPAQTDHIDRLANDLQYNRKLRNLNISELVNHPITYLDELTISEASAVIAEFIKRRGY
jgi:hypothetical protein